MSNYRKVIKRRDHWERPQPEARSKLGLLEKHVDYVKRARNFHSKEDRLNALKAAARNRNPDEFYHRMESRHEGIDKKGVHVRKRSSTLQHESLSINPSKIKMLKTQDRNYLLMHAQQEKRKIEKARQSLQSLDVLSHLHTEQSTSIGADDDEKMQPESDDDDDDDDEDDEPAVMPQARRHVVFTDEGQDLSQFDAAKHFDTVPELLSRAHNRLTVEQLSLPLFQPTAAKRMSTVDNRSSSKQLQSLEKDRAREYAALLSRVKRAKIINSSLQRVDLQRTLMGKGPRVKSVVRDKFGDVDESKTVFRWKLQRKR